MAEEIQPGNGSETIPENGPEKKSETEKKSDQKLKQQQRAENLVDFTEGMTTVVFMLESFGSGAKNLAPVLALTGLGAPAAVVLYLAAKGFELKVKKSELMYVVNHTINILTQCYLLHGSICAHLLKIMQNEKASKIIISQDNTKDLAIDSIIIENITNTLYKIKYLVEKVMPRDDKSRYNKFTRSYNRMFSPEFYKNQLLKELTLLNGYFIIYETKFTRIVDVYKFYIKNPDGQPTTNNDQNSQTITNDGQTTIDEIYKELYADENYTNYIKGGGFKVIEKTLETQIKENPSIISDINQKASEYIKNIDNIDGNQGVILPPSSPSTGGKRTRRRKSTKSSTKFRKARRSRRHIRNRSSKK